MKSRFTSVLAHWYDTKSASRMLIPAVAMPHSKHRNAIQVSREAEAAARFKLEALKCRTLGALSLPGNPALVAEASLHLEGFPDGVDGDYTIAREHRFHQKKRLAVLTRSVLPDIKVASVTLTPVSRQIAAAQSHRVQVSRFWYTPGRFRLPDLPPRRNRPESVCLSQDRLSRSRVPPTGRRQHHGKNLLNGMRRCRDSFPAVSGVSQAGSHPYWESPSFVFWLTRPGTPR